MSGSRPPQDAGEEPVAAPAPPYAAGKTDAPRAPTRVTPHSGPPTPSSPPLPVSTPPPPARSSTPPGVDADRIRRQALAARLSGGRIGSTRPPPPASSAPPPPAPRTTPPVGLPSVDPRATPLVEAAAAAAASGDLDEAARQYRAAVDIDSDPALRAAYEATAARAKDQQFDKALAEATEAEKAQRWAAAGAAYVRAFELKPSARLAHLAATAIRHTRANLQRGLHYAEQALRLEPNRVVHHLSLSLLLQDTGETIRARAAFEKARALDPNHPGLAAVQARLKAR